MGLGISVFALGTTQEKLGFIIVAAITFTLAFIGFIYMSVKAFLLWRANKALEKVIGTQKKK